MFMSFAGVRNLSRTVVIGAIVLPLAQFIAALPVRATAASLPNVYISLENGTFAEYSMEASTITAVFHMAPMTGFRKNDPWLRMNVNRYREFLLSDDLDGSLFLWNGEKEVPKSELAGGCSQYANENAWEQIRVFLSTRKGVYYVASNCHYNTVKREDAESGSAERVIFTLRKFSASSGTREILRKEYPVCECSTGSCSESCAKGVISVPGGIFDSKFIFKSYVEGQLESKTEEHLLYTFSNWRCDAGKALPPDLSVFDIAADNTVLGGYADKACCGWANTFSDRAVMLSSGGVGVNVYDEFQSYDNAKVDVNFSVSAMSFSPSGDKFVLQVTADYPYDRVIRWGADHPVDEPVDVGTSSRILSLAEATPAIKVIDRMGKLIENVPGTYGASFAGWLDEDRILLKGKDKLVLFNLANNAQKILPVPGVVLVFVPK